MRWIHEMDLSFDTRITRLQNNRYKYQQQGREIAKQKDPLHMMCCMLYWAEGSKSETVMTFVNSDVNMLILFARFIQTYFPYKTVKLRINYYQETIDQYESIEQYWKTQIGQELKNFVFKKPTIRNKYYNKPEIIKYPYGILRMSIQGVDIIHNIYGAIQEYIGVDINKMSPIIGSTQF